MIDGSSAVTPTALALGPVLRFDPNLLR